VIAKNWFRAVGLLLNAASHRGYARNQREDITQIEQTDQWRSEMVNRSLDIYMALIGLAKYCEKMTPEESAQFKRLGLEMTTILDEMIAIVDPNVLGDGPKSNGGEA